MVRCVLNTFHTLQTRKYGGNAKIADMNGRLRRADESRAVRVLFAQATRLCAG